MANLPSMLNGVPTNSQLAGPLGDCQAFAVPLNPVRHGSVSALFNWCSPPAIRRAVSKSVVDSIYRVARRWALPHVGVEIGKGTPSISDYQAFRAIFFEQCVLWIMATLNDVRPNVVFAGLVKPMRGVESFIEFTLKASARLNVALSQMIRANRCQLSAFALAFKPSAAVIPRGTIGLAQNL